MMGESDAGTSLALSLRFCAAGALIQTLEVLSQHRELRDDRLLGWAGPGRATNLFRGLVRVLWSFPGCAWMLALRAGLALGCLAVSYESVAAFWLIGGLLLAQLYYNRRFLMLAGNCETLFLVCLAGAWAGSLPDASARLRDAALLFIAGHALLAYLVAGGHKLGSCLWRSGARLRQIALFGSYRLPSFARRALSTNRRAMLWSAGVIGLELALACAVIFPAPIFFPLLTAGFVFHTLVAVTMGLHGFWWTFTAAYPAVIYVHGLLR